MTPAQVQGRAQFTQERNMNAEEAVSQETDIRAKSLFYAPFQQSALTIVLCDGVIGIFVA